MAKYLMQGDYTVAGIKGLVKEGGSGREVAVQKLCASLGGSLDALYYSSVTPSYFVIVNVPDKTSVAAISLAIVAAGGVTIAQCVEILTPAEMDGAVKKDPAYRAPGA